MKNSPIISFVTYVLVCVVLFSEVLLAQRDVLKVNDLTDKAKRKFYPVPDFTKGGKKNDRHDWNLGPTGARGWMWGMELRTEFARQILITKVDKGSPADGVLKVDDVILGVNGRNFKSDARIAFGKAITEAEKSKNRGKLNLVRWRDGKTENVMIQLKVMGEYAKLSPMRCKKSEQIIKDACAYIEKNGIGKRVYGMVNALGLLASGEKRYLPMVMDYIYQLKVEDAYQMSTWNMGYMNILISEYYLLTKDKKVLPKIRHMAKYLAEGQGKAGTWGHNRTLPSGQLPGYGAMCQPSLSCAVSLILNQKCGVTSPEIELAIKRSNIFFSSFVHKGGIPYGDHAPSDVHDSNGRSSVAVIFFHLMNNRDAYEFFARMTVASYSQREEGHTGNYWSYIWGPLGAVRAGSEALAAFMEPQQWFYDLERRWDGGFTYQGGANMKGSEHTTPGWDTTGARLLTYAIGRGKLEITGRNMKLESPLKGKELEDTIAAGEGYNVWLRKGLITKDVLDKLSGEELLKLLDTWSMPQRIRAAKALARKPKNYVPKLMRMLDSKDRSVILGGIYGLEHQREKARPAINKLVSLLEHDDEWIRFRAGFALCQAGDKAREKAVPVLLKMATKTFPNDPREISQRYIAFVLWGSGYNGSPRGLLRKGMQGVDHDALVMAIKRLIKNQDGLVRSYVSHAIKMMTFEELTPLWSEITWAIKNPSPSGMMFSSTIREVGLETMSKYRLKETVEAGGQFVLTMKPHGSEKRIKRVMAVLKSFGKEARHALPALHEARKFFGENLGPDKPMRFPQWATDKLLEGIEQGIADIEKATDVPEGLRSLK